MKKLFGVLFGLLAFAASAVNTVTTAPKAGVDYQVMKGRQPDARSSAEKIEVLEFFWYGCPHCKDFDPILQAWIQKQKSGLIFKRVPVAFQAALAPHQRLYHALDALGIAEQMTPKIFKAVLVDGNALLTLEAQADFVAKNGIDKDKYISAYHSFSAVNAVQRDNKLLTDYAIDGVPAIVVQGKYKTSPSMTKDFQRLIQTLDFIVAQVRAKKM